MARRPQVDEAEVAFPKQRKPPKTRLRLPDLEFSKVAVLNSLTSVDANADTATRSTSSSIGTARNRDWP
jgi:hypothetical protein